MLKLSKYAVALFAMALVVGFAGSAYAAGTGTIKGTVVGADGKPAAGVTVKLFAKTEKGGDKAAPAAADGGGKRAKRVAVAEATTNDKGEFTMNNVPAGEYNIGAGGKGIGGAHSTVTVKSGGTETVSLTLKAHTGGGKGQGKHAKDGAAASAK
jgi:protocatechuate 3,4-dioxygenase beta subunit